MFLRGGWVQGNLHLAASFPQAATTPENSWPRVMSNVGLGSNLPETMCRSVPHRPEDFTCTRT